ncbi:pyrroline-5-carboxylate reductase [Pelagirhabdus alkalitolerans]|uniref:Pyrroline-5-carboxylate reductase n=1 Tax=Pelagirhabdus alkalitolerans TaxID=1612202 RepID=A0A1G6IZ98_9BACI|nr:pyrroline-5-carboxylate reductase [Pelagirhabdus alkalitolerans]SDC11824.1 pyrroline-5-carboxylate reductase [Pelagirhabdus alkalitolerans]
MRNHVHFIGGGQMSEAIIRALLKNRVFNSNNITVTDLNKEREQHLTETYQVVTDQKEEDVLTQANLIVIGVRPQDDLKTVCQTIYEHASDQATIVSIVAGVTIAQFEAWLDSDRAIARVIPNTLTDTGRGYSGVALNAYANQADLDPFLNGFGKVTHIDEALIDAFTGYGVAGPNYIYYFIESLVDAGVLAGLPRDMAWEVALENMVGAVEMLNESGKHPRQLLDINNSPAGVGMNGLHQLNASDFAAGLQRSVLKAVERTTELSNQEGD